MNAYLRPPGDEEPVPGGWAVHTFEWNGREREVAYDPRRHQVLVAPDDVVDDLEDRLTRAGWEYHGTDGLHSLWLRDTVAAAHAALDRPAPTRGIGGLGL